MPLSSLFQKNQTSPNRKNKRPSAADIDPPTNPGRHRTSELESDEAVPDTELESYLAALAPEPDTETTSTGGSFGSAKTHRVRLNAIASEQLREIAEARGMTPHELAQEWVLQRLNWEAQQYHPGPAVAR